MSGKSSYDGGGWFYLGQDSNEILIGQVIFDKETEKGL